MLEPIQGQLQAKPHARPISCHVISVSWQEQEEELNKLFSDEKETETLR